MTNLEKIRQAVIKANPEIVELKFGCEVEFNDSSREVIIGISLENIEVERVQTRTHYQIGVSNITEIIGRPIRLADVLLAIGKNDPMGRNGIQDYMDILIKWKLKDDNLDNQSKECIEFIHGLLN